MTMRIRLADQSDKMAWDGYVHAFHGAAAYSLYGWKEAVERTYGFKGHYLLAEDNAKIVGILPLFQFRIPLVSHSLVALPYCDVGDVLADEQTICNQLIREAVSLGQRLKANAVQIRSCTEQLVDTNIPWSCKVQTGKVRMLLPLPASSDELWKSFKSKLRSQIRKAEKNDLVFRWGNLDDVAAFYRVFSRNMHALGSPVHSRQWIHSVLESYGENARMGLVMKGGQPVGCGIILMTDKTVSIPWASTLREFNRLSPNMLLYWNFLKFAADDAKQQFDFGRSTPNEGTFRFKKQWGAKPQPLYWYTLSRAGSTRSSNGKQRLSRDQIARLWSKMPLSLATYLGPKLRRYISL